MLRVLFVMTFGFLAIGCTSTKPIAIVMKEPSPVTIPNKIKTIGIINATKPSATKIESKDELEAVAARDEQWISSKGTEASIDGLIDVLMKDRRFENVNVINQPGIGQKIGEGHLDTTAWNEIADLCEIRGVDAIFALAHFDVDTKVTVKKAMITRMDLMRTEQKSKGKEITVETLIENGWRIFDPVKRMLIDEIATNDQIVLSSQGGNLNEAFHNLGSRRQSALDLSKNTGKAYGQRLKPAEKVVNREYFTKGDKQLLDTYGLIQDGEVAMAIEKLKPLVFVEDTNLSSKACHNLAVLSEFQGKVDEALHWAIKSTELNNNVINEEYVEDLRRRQIKDILIQQQYLEIGFVE